MGEAYRRLGRNYSCIQNLVGKYEEKRPLEKPRRRWRDNNNMNGRKVSRLCGLGSSRYELGFMAGCYIHGNKLSASIKDEEFDYTSIHWLLRACSIELDSANVQRKSMDVLEISTKRTVPIVLTLKALQPRQYGSNDLGV
jgi:hypothetical protein